MRSTVMTFAVPLTLLSAACADQGVSRVLIDRNLHERQIMLVGVDDRQVAYRDGDGLLRSEPVQRIVAITSPKEMQTRDTSGAADDGLAETSILELTDGQRIIGDFVPAGPETSPGETIRWVHPLLGEMTFRLDDIQRITLVAIQSDEAADAVGDVVLLRNGDRLEGFIESIGAGVHLDSSGQMREIPLDRIATIVLANPATRLSGSVLWLQDTSIVASSRFSHVPEGQIAFFQSARRRNGGDPHESESEALPVVVGEVMAIAFHAERIVPLAGLPVLRQEPIDGRRWSQPVRRAGRMPALLNTPDIELPGPMVVEWELPPGADQFAAEAELPRANWNWGDCVLVVSLVGGSGEAEREIEVSRTRINADNPRVPIRISLEAQSRHIPRPLRLRVRLDPGLYGPIQDQIILRRPLVLLAETAG